MSLTSRSVTSRRSPFCSHGSKETLRRSSNPAAASTMSATLCSSRQDGSQRDGFIEDVAISRQQPTFGHDVDIDFQEVA